MGNQPDEALERDPSARLSGGPLLPLILAALAFAPSLWAGFLYDDLRDIVRNPAAQAETFVTRLPDTLRPLLKASYAVQDALTGMAPAAFHAANMGLHLVAVLLVHALLRRAARLGGRSAAEAARIAWIAALVWAVHPALADTVAYVSGRSTGLSSVLLLGCLMAATTKRPRWLPAFVLAFAAPLARETALIAPLLLLVWQATLCHKDRWQLQLLRAVPVWLGALAAGVIIAAMGRHRDLLAFSLDQRAPLDALRANVFAVPEILRLWVQPWRISILPEQPVVDGWADAATQWRLGVLVGVSILALALRRQAPLVAFAGLWTLVSLVPTNSVIWRVDPVAIRPLYLAGLGLSLLLALALARLPLGRGLALALSIGLGVMSWDRATLFQDEVALFADAVAKAPQNARNRLMLGLVQANAGRVDEAREALGQALQIDPFLTEALNALRLLDAATPIYRPGP